MNKKLKISLGLIGAFIAYRAYKLWEMSNGIQYFFKHMRFAGPTSNIATDYRMQIVYRIVNPTRTTFASRGIWGEVWAGGGKIAFYKTNPFIIKPGEQDLNVSVILNPAYVVQYLLPMLKNMQTPIFDVKMTIGLPMGFSHTQTFKVNMKDYIPDYILQAAKLIK
jgi:hypothetical protein